jgi:hypothetical protein
MAARVATIIPNVPIVAGSPSANAFNVIAHTTEANAICEPALKSMPPLVITMVIPSAPMPTITVWVIMVLAFLLERKDPRLSGSKAAISAVNSPKTNTNPINGSSNDFQLEPGRGSFVIVNLC